MGSVLADRDEQARFIIFEKTITLSWEENQSHFPVLYEAQIPDTPVMGKTHKSSQFQCQCEYDGACGRLTSEAGLRSLMIGFSLTDRCSW